MTDPRTLIERELDRVERSPLTLEGLHRRREQKQRRKGLTAGAVGLAIAAAVALAGITALHDRGPDDPVTQPPPTVTEPPAPLVELDAGLHIVDVKTGEASPLPARIADVEGAGNFSVSPDGSMILFDTPGISLPGFPLVTILVANIDGSARRPLTDGLRPPSTASLGSWSPDGTKVVAFGGSYGDVVNVPGEWPYCRCPDSRVDLMVVDVATGATTRVAQGAAQDFQHPFFAADGSRIVFTRRDDPADEGPGDPLVDDLWTIPVGGGPQELLLEDVGYAVPSPDGTSILYPRLVTWNTDTMGGGYNELWISDADGGHPRALFDDASKQFADRPAPGEAVEGPPDWSPDGARIAYPSDRSIYVLDVGTGHATLITDGWRRAEWLDDHTLIIRAT